LIFIFVYCVDMTDNIDRLILNKPTQTSILHRAIAAVNPL